MAPQRLRLWHTCRLCELGAIAITPCWFWTKCRRVSGGPEPCGGYEHFDGVVPDLTTWGKGISSSLPIAAVAGRPDLMDLPAPGSASSTHSGNPVCVAAALASCGPYFA